MTQSRRQFLASASAAVVAGSVAPSLGLAIDPIKRPGNKPDIKLSLAAYSFRDALNIRKPTMTLFDFMDFAATLPLDGVELTSYYWAESSDEYIKKLKDYAAKKKLAISGVPVGNNFCTVDDTKRKADIQHVKDWTVRTAKIGAPTMRIFAGYRAKDDPLDKAQKRVIAAFEECCPVAEKNNVLLAVENHGTGITDTPADLLALVKPIKSTALGLNVDTGNFTTADPYADIAKIVPYGVVAQIKTEVSPNGKKKADLGRMIKIFKDANFQGYIALEYEEKEDPKIVVPKVIKELRSLIG